MYGSVLVKAVRRVTVRRRGRLDPVIAAGYVPRGDLARRVVAGEGIMYLNL